MASQNRTGSLIPADRDPNNLNDSDAAAIATELSHFRSVPLAQPTISDPFFVPIPISRNLTHNNRGHTLMAGTWKTPETIAHLLSFIRLPSSSQPATAELDTNENTRIEVCRFYTFGTGLNAHADLLHGGVIASILDSTMANVSGLVVNEAGMFTVQLNIRFQKAVVTPGTVKVRAWAKSVERDDENIQAGKGEIKKKNKLKVWVNGEVTGGENGEVVHATAEGLWIKAVVNTKL